MDESFNFKRNWLSEKVTSGFAKSSMFIILVHKSETQLRVRISVFNCELEMIRHL